MFEKFAAKVEDYEKIIFQFELRETELWSEQL